MKLFKNHKSKINPFIDNLKEDNIQLWLAIKKYHTFNERLDELPENYKMNFELTNLN